tara:strand:- start:665 stop:853 length:189 start_codon:yes stop_codon:yes gene_type:complete
LHTLKHSQEAKSQEDTKKGKDQINIEFFHSVKVIGEVSHPRKNDWKNDYKNTTYKGYKWDKC